MVVMFFFSTSSWSQVERLKAIKTLHVFLPGILEFWNFGILAFLHSCILAFFFFSLWKFTFLKS